MPRQPTARLIFSVSETLKKIKPRLILTILVKLSLSLKQDLIVHVWVGYDRITLRRSRNRNQIFYYLIPVLLTGTGICHGKSGSGRTGTGFFRIESGSGKNRISRSDRNSGRNRNIMNANPARTEIAENDKNRVIG